jgi:acetylornithine deacetylase/succinyl-diaminopimelate desuccinylase-like protein
LHLHRCSRILQYTAAILALCALCFAAPPSETQKPTDEEAAQRESQQILTDLIRIDTSGGDETKAAEYIQGILKHEGIESHIYELQPGRGNLVARMKGSGKKKPILLMGHLDVVGVQREHWDTDPFAPTIKDGYLYGRGAMDDKGMVTANLEAFLQLHRQHVSLDRDVIFLAEAGEEGEPKVGIDFMIEKHWDEIAAESCLNEGGGIVLVNGEVQYVAVSTTEKVPWPTKLIASGHSGHASVPVPDNPVTHLAAAVEKAGTFEMPAHLDVNAIAFFHGLARISPLAEAQIYGKLDDPIEGKAAEEQLAKLNPRYAATLRTTVVPTMISGGFRTNVIPAQAEATLDIRVLPQDKIEDVVAALRKAIDDPLVEVVPATTARPTSAASPTDSDMFRALTEAQNEMFPHSATLPMLLPATTDAAQLRAKGMFVYGLGGAQTTNDRERVHGNNERIAVPAIGQFSEFIYRAVLHAVTD